MAKSKKINPIEMFSSAGKVISARLNYIASEAGKPSPELMREVNQMWSEKVFAFHKSFAQMAFTSLEINQKFASSAWQNYQALATNNHKHLHKTIKQSIDDAEQVIQSGLEPVHLKVAANRKRLKT